MSETPRKPDEPQDEYSLAPESSPSPPDPPSSLGSIGSLMEGIDEDAASDEKAMLRSVTREGVASFDPQTGRRRPNVLTGDDPTENTLKSDDGPVVAVGKLGWKAPAIVAGTLFVVTLVLAVVSAERGEAWRAVGHELLHIPINVGLGMLAVFALSRLAERPLGYWRGALARMAMAVVAFHALMNLDLNFGGAPLVQWLGGAAVYFGALWATTRMAVRETFVAAGVHFGLWAVVQFLFWVAPMVSPKAEPAPEVAQPARRVDQVSPPARP